MLRLPRHLLAAHAVHAALPIQKRTPGRTDSVRARAWLALFLTAVALDTMATLCAES